MLLHANPFYDFNTQLIQNVQKVKSLQLRYAEACPKFFHQGQIQFLGGGVRGRDIFNSGRIAHAKNKKYCCKYESINKTHP